MSTVDQIYERIEDSSETLCYEKGDSEIVKFFSGNALFITGATGFLGKCLLEKLLRSCSDIKHIYMLMRKNGSRSLKEREEKYFQNVIFSRLGHEYPDFRKKVTVLRGDLMAENLGLSDKDRRIIINDVNIIYHNAANVKFDVKASLSLKVNVLGTKKVLELAQQCKHLKVFVYVSTAYSHLYRNDIEEKFYPPPADLKTVYEIIEADESTKKGLTEEALRTLIGQYPNIYPYTKAIAEDLVRQYAKKAGFVHIIYRPSIVTSAYREPLAGWCGNLNGPVYIFLAAALGFIRVMYYCGYPMDYIPLDLTINGLLAVTWDAHNQWNKGRRHVCIYNYGSSTTNPLDFKMIQKYFDDIPADERSSRTVALPSTAIMTSRLWLFYILHILFHFIPACLVDSMLLLAGKKPRVLAIFWKATKHMDKIIYFGNGNWKIYMPKTLEVIDKMSPVDSEMFFCDIRKLPMEEASRITWRGLKYYILKEDVNSEAGRRRYQLVCYMQYIFRAIFVIIIFYILYKITNCATLKYLKSLTLKVEKGDVYV